MLSTTGVHPCRQCGSERIRKNGHVNNGAQWAKCLACGRTFHLEPKGPRYDQAFKAQVLAAYQDRLSTRGIRRTSGVCYQTLMHWMRKTIKALHAFRRDALTQPKRRRARTR